MSRFVTLALLTTGVLLSSASAQVRHRRPYRSEAILGYGFDNDNDYGRCTDYRCVVGDREGRGPGVCYGDHTGEDFWVAERGAIVAGQDGRVIYTFNSCGNNGSRGNPCGDFCGNHVTIQHSDGTRSRYCHMLRDTLRVGMGDRVTCGQMLGQVGSSGSSTAPHLHFAYETSSRTRQVAYEGACGRNNTRWVQQRGYREAPGTSCGQCSGTETRNCGSAVGRCERGTQRCSGGSWGDCSGTGPRSERCDGVDDDCDGEVDEGLARDCGSSVGACETGRQRCVDAAWGACRGEVAPTAELCNDADDDCDGNVDEGDTASSRSSSSNRPTAARATSTATGWPTLARSAMRASSATWRPAMASSGWFPAPAWTRRIPRSSRHCVWRTSTVTGWPTPACVSRRGSVAGSPRATASGTRWPGRSSPTSMATRSRRATPRSGWST